MRWRIALWEWRGRRRARVRAEVDALWEQGILTDEDRLTVLEQTLYR